MAAGIGLFSRHAISAPGSQAWEQTRWRRMLGYIPYLLGLAEHPDAETWRRAGERVVDTALAGIEEDKA